MAKKKTQKQVKYKFDKLPMARLIPPRAAAKEQLRATVRWGITSLVLVAAVTGVAAGLVALQASLVDSQVKIAESSSGIRIESEEQFGKVIELGTALEALQIGIAGLERTQVDWDVLLDGIDRGAGASVKVTSLAYGGAEAPDGAVCTGDRSLTLSLSSDSMGALAGAVDSLDTGGLFSCVDAQAIVPNAGSYSITLGVTLAGESNA